MLKDSTGVGQCFTSHDCKFERPPADFVYGLRNLPLLNSRVSEQCSQPSLRSSRLCVKHVPPSLSIKSLVYSYPSGSHCPSTSILGGLSLFPTACPVWLWNDVFGAICLSSPALSQRFLCHKSRSCIKHNRSLIAVASPSSNFVLQVDCHHL
jgi:hypothetical protein